MLCLEALQCPTLCDPMNCRLPSSSVHGILLSIILESVAISSSRGSSRPRNWTHIYCISCFVKYSLPLMQPGKNDAIKMQIKSCLSFAQNHTMIHYLIGIKARVFMIVCKVLHNLNLLTLLLCLSTLLFSQSKPINQGFFAVSPTSRHASALLNISFSLFYTWLILLFLLGLLWDSFFK